MKEIILEIKDHVAILTVNRQLSLNALNRSLLQELEEVLTKQLPHTDITGMILTGSGDKAFIAGADIKEMSESTAEEIEEFLTLGQHVANLLEQAPFITIACVNGFALGGGLEMALACDFIYASENAKLGLPEVSLGIIPGFGGTQRLTRAIGTRKAKELILTGEVINAQQAKDWGIVNKVFPQQELLAEADKTIHIASHFSKIALQKAKTAINRGGIFGMEQGLELEKQLFSICFATEERKLAMQAFLHKKTKASR